MAEYVELSAEALTVISNIEKRAKQFLELKGSMWSFEYLGVMLRDLFSPRHIQPTRCCSLPSARGRPRLFLPVKRDQEMRVEVVAVTNLARLSELEEPESVSISSEVDASPHLEPAESLDKVQRDIYVEVRLGSCRYTAPLDPDSVSVHRNMLFAYDGELTSHVRVFEKSGMLIRSMFAGDTFIGEANLLLDPPAEDFAPRSVDLPIRRKGKQTGIVMLRYQLLAY
eukprot:UN0818